MQAVCERIIVINNGRLVADGATDTLAHDLSPEHRLTLRAEAPEQELVQQVSQLPGVVEAFSLGEKEPGVYEVSVETEPDADVRRPLFSLLAQRNWPLLALKNSDLTLEDLFLRLTSTDAAYLPEEQEAASLDPEQDQGQDGDADQDAPSPEAPEKGENEQ